MFNMTTQAQVRAAFWRDHDGANGVNSRVKINSHDGRGKMYNTDTRCAFADYVDLLARDGQISEALAGRVTL